MRKIRHTTPEGTRDLLFEECALRRKTESQLTGLFKQYGFGEVMTPGIEFLDVFNTSSCDGGCGTGSLPIESMYKMVDSNGRILVMRPDVTLPIARLVSTRLANANVPLRLYYAQDVWRFNAGLSGFNDQLFQAGVELIGINGKKADLEILWLASQSLEMCLGKAVDYKIEIGHASFSRSLIEEIDVSEEIREKLQTLIETKNYAALGNLLDSLPKSTAVDAVKRLPRLFGGREVLCEAAKYSHNEGAKKALKYLETLYNELCNLGLGDRVIIDFGLAHRQEYYTGVIFRGYIQGSGDTVLSGGRYDSLLGQYGKPLPATGFGINVDSITQQLLTLQDQNQENSEKVLVHGERGNEIEALQRLEQLHQKGVPCEYSLFDTIEQAKEYAKQKQIKNIEII